MWLSEVRWKSILLDVFDMVSFLVFVWWIVLFVRFFVANPFTVIGASMEPNFSEKDFIVVDKISQRFSEWERGDVIVFVATGKTDPYIKRIIGLPWEIVKFKEGKVLICHDSKGEEICERLDESSYLSDTVSTEARCNKAEFEITDWFFVLGDNRWLSTDSLCCFGLGCYDGATYTVPENRIIGKVFIRFFPHFSVF